MNTGNGGFLSHGSTPKSSKSSIYRLIFHNKPSSELGVPPFMEPPYILLYHVVHQPLVNSPKYQIYIHLPNINIFFHGWVNISGWWIWNMFFPYIGNNNPNWLIFFRGVETTNQICCMMWYPPNHWFSHPSWCAHLATSHWNSRQNRNVHRDGKPIGFRSCFRSRQTIGFMMQICDN